MIIYCLHKLFLILNTYSSLLKSTKTTPCIDMPSSTSPSDKDLANMLSTTLTDIQTLNAWEKRLQTGQECPNTSEKTKTSLNGEQLDTPPVYGLVSPPPVPVKKRKSFYYQKNLEMQFSMHGTLTTTWIKCSQCNRLHRSCQGVLLNLYCPLNLNRGFQ